MKDPLPPAVWTWLLRKVLRDPSAEIERAIGALYQVRRQRDGAAAADRWYGRQVRGFVLRGLKVTAFPGDDRFLISEGTGVMERCVRWSRNISLAARSLARRPTFAVLAVGTLALGIGSTTAVFSVIYGSLYSPLPFADEDRLVWLSDGHDDFGGAGANQSVPNFLDLQSESSLLSASAVFKVRSANLATAEQPERVSVLSATSDFLTVLGVRPQLGRDLRSEDDLYGAGAVALLTDELWRGRFGSDVSVLGRTTSLNGRTVEIVGVLPKGFYFPGQPQVLMPLEHVGAPLARGNRGHYSIGRLATGADVTSLRSELREISDRLAQTYPEANEGFFAWADPLTDYVGGRNRGALLLLGGAVGLLLLMTCANVANLVLVRAEGRSHEVAVRYSLGATPGDLFPLYLTEGALLALLGAGVGLVLAEGVLRVLKSAYASTLPRPDQVVLNPTVILFALGVALIVGLVLALTPIRRSQRENLASRIRVGRHGASRGEELLRRGLVVAEVALAVLLVSSAALLTKSVGELQGLDLGIEKEEQILTFRVSLPAARYNEPGVMERFYEDVLTEAERLPGVVAAGFVNRLPLLGGDNVSVAANDEPDREVSFVSHRMITPGYFEALGTRLVKGRWLDPSVFSGGEPSIIINETLARELFPGREPVGLRMADPFVRPGDSGWRAGGYEVSGVIRDIAAGRPGSQPPPAFYIPFQSLLRLLELYPLPVGGQLEMSAVVLTDGEPYALAPDLRSVIAQADPSIPIFEVRTLHDIALSRLGSRRLAMSLLGAFAGLALLLGATGVYGVMAYAVAQRNRELGVRLALGARRRAVLAIVLRDGLRLAIPGLAVGVVLAVGAGALLESLLFGVGSRDPVTLIGVVGVLGLTSVLAALWPAYRATRIDPLVSLKGE